MAKLENRIKYEAINYEGFDESITFKTSKRQRNEMKKFIDFVKSDSCGITAFEFENEAEFLRAAIDYLLYLLRGAVFVTQKKK